MRWSNATGRDVWAHRDAVVEQPVFPHPLAPRFAAHKRLCGDVGPRAVNEEAESGRH